MSFIEEFSKTIDTSTCNVVCWIDSDGFFKEHTDNHYFIGFNKTLNEAVRKYTNEHVNLSDDEELDAMANAVFENASANRPLIASENDIHIAEKLHLAIKQIEGALEDAKRVIIPEFDLEDSFEIKVAEDNLDLLKSFCDFYISDKDGAIGFFFRLQNYIRTGSKRLYNIPIPYNYEDDDVFLVGRKINFREKSNIPEKKLCYRVDNLYEYCFTLLHYLTSHKCRLRKCKRCGRYYVPNMAIRNSAYCYTIDSKIGKSCLELSKNRKLPYPNIYKKIYNRLLRRSGAKAEEQLKQFISAAKEHRKKISQGLESQEDYQLWLVQQDQNTRKRF